MLPRIGAVEILMSGRNDFAQLPQWNRTHLLSSSARNCCSSPRAHRRAAGELHGIHGEHAGDVHFAGAGEEFFAHHAHERADVAAVIFLHGGPALDGGGVEAIGVHPIGEHNAHFGHLHEFLGRHAGRGRVAGDFRELGFHGGGTGIQLAGVAKNFREVNGGDTNAVAFENFFRIAHGVKGTGPGADGTEAHTMQAVDHAADAEKFLQVGFKTRRAGIGNVFARERKFDAGLDEVVADGNFSAEGIAAAGGERCFRSSGYP